MVEHRGHVSGTLGQVGTAHVATSVEHSERQSPEPLTAHDFHISP
jgi:hypothetical protein